MSLVRWFRKNNTKVMAVVVIILMIAFVGGSSLSYILQPDRGGLKRTFATFAGNVKIKGRDLDLANRELGILKTLRSDIILSQMLQVPLTNTPDLQAFLLGELLFSEQRTSPVLMSQIKRTIQSNLYNISEKQINDMYRRSIPGSSVYYWHCLKSEARLAGIRVPSENVGELLGKAIPQLFQGRSYSQVIGSIVNQQGITEQQILETFGNLLAVLQYAHLICSGEDITTRQLMQTVAWEQEGVGVEFVEFNSATFAKTQEEPDQETMVEHFNKYKKYFPGEVSDENPYGFGYKLPDRVQLEYIAVRADEISSIVESPTQDELEEYYDRYKEQLFTEQVQTDPNNPNSLTTQIKSYSSVANIISKQMKQDKIDVIAENIIQEAISLTEVSLQDINEAELANLSSEELAKMVGDYKAAAETLTQKHKLKVHTGRTGMLNAIDIQTDEFLSRAYLLGFGQNPVPLTKVVFAIDELAASELGPFDVQTPRMYANIGPVRDMLSLQGIPGEMIAIIRVIQATKATDPENINETFSTRSLLFDPNDQETNEDVYSVKEQVTEDLKKLAALETVKSKAEEFIELASNEDWQSAVDKFNEIYGQDDKEDPNDPNLSETEEAEKTIQDTFKLENFTGLRMISKAILNALAVQSEGNPAARYVANEQKRRILLIEQLYSLLPEDSNNVENLPLVMEFKPDMSFYCIKDLSIKRLWKEDYDKIKARRLFTEDTVQSQSLAAVYFNPENILMRMNLKLVEAEEESEETSSPEGSEGAL